MKHFPSCFLILHTQSHKPLLSNQCRPQTSTNMHNRLNVVLNIFFLTPDNPVSSINKTDRLDITEILLKMAINTINPNLSLLKRSPVFNDIFHHCAFYSWHPHYLLKYFTFNMSGSISFISLPHFFQPIEKWMGYCGVDDGLW
jgi:hypothetical protein